MRYKIYQSDRKTIVVSTYAGKPVRGVSICSLEDEYNEATGIEIAKARCDAKIAMKRLKRAEDKLREAIEQAKNAKKYLHKMEDYYNDAFTTAAAAVKEAHELESR